MRRNLIILSTLLVWSWSNYAQNTVSITGRAIDAQTREPLLGVNILLEGTNQGATTDIDGRYEIEEVAPGSYNITASYIGYSSNTRSNVIVQSKGNDDINFELSPTDLELETVDVRANQFKTSIVSPNS